jgi:hypothetical protein
MTNNRFFHHNINPKLTELRKHQLLDSCLEKLIPPQGCNFFPPIPEPPAGSLCDCCVSPLQFVLQQLIGQTVILGTIADTPGEIPFFFLVRINAVNDFLVTVTNEETDTTYVVNISDVTGVGFSLTGPSINLLPPVDSGGDCDCRERPIRQLLDTLIGSTVNLLASNGSIATDFNVEQTGLGIVLGTLPISPGNFFRFAISTCKIIAVQTN